MSYLQFYTLLSNLLPRRLCCGASLDQHCRGKPRDARKTPVVMRRSRLPSDRVSSCGHEFLEASNYPPNFEPKFRGNRFL